MKNKNFYLLLVLSILSINLVLAVPGIPHQFYGDVYVNDELVPDNNIIVASIGGDTYFTITKDGKYGFSPNIFYIEDPNGDRAGETITFSIGGMDVKNHVFEDYKIIGNCYDELNFLGITTFCGDNYCLGDETCASCPNDCGICTDPPVITINSPENKIYDNLKIDLIVSADQDIILWLYNLNNKGFVTFAPNITLTAQEGENNITVEGRNENGQYGSSTVFFTVELPVSFCGDGLCNNGETCSTCPGDCGACSSGGGGSSGGGSSGGGGGSSGTTSNTQNNDAVSLSFETEEEESEEESEDKTTTYEQTEQQGNFISGITGAVLGLGNKLGKLKSIIIIVFIIGIIGVFVFVKVRKKKSE